KSERIDTGVLSGTMRIEPCDRSILEEWVGSPLGPLVGCSCSPPASLMLRARRVGLLVEVPLGAEGRLEAAPWAGSLAAVPLVEARLVAAPAALLAAAAWGVVLSAAALSAADPWAGDPSAVVSAAHLAELASQADQDSPAAALESAAPKACMAAAASEAMGWPALAAAAFQGSAQATHLTHITPIPLLTGLPPRQVGQQ